MKKRIEWIDIARGITMISVVIGHSLYGYNNGLLSHFIYTFHMPIFFILTGYLYDEFTIEVQQMIKKKTHSLSPCKI
ncbi:acyltransferase family protein [Lactiplantibacillus argentoratensis]